MTQDEQLVRRNISLYASDWEIVRGADFASSGISASLRRIVREWHRWHRRVMVDSSGDYHVGTIEPEPVGVVE